MLRGGQGGEVRLKTYLAILWIAAGAGHSVEFPAHSFARLLDLDDPYGNGARRGNDALRWLHKNRLVELQPRPGREPIITLLSDEGSGRSYEIPGAAEKDAVTKKAKPENIYFKLPPGFWVNGWAAHLPPSAVAMMLMLLDRNQSGTGDPIWIAPDRLKETYVFSDDTRSRGIAVLEDTGIVYVGKQQVSEDFGYRRVRNTYLIEPDLLKLPVERGILERRARLHAEMGGHKSDVWRSVVRERLRTLDKEETAQAEPRSPQ